MSAAPARPPGSASTPVMIHGRARFMAMAIPSWSALLTPGRKLMDRLSLSWKFTIVAGVIVLPVVLLGWLYYSNINAQIASAQDELNGGEMFKPAVSLLQAVQVHSVSM